MVGDFMKNKIVISMLLLLLMTGCSANYSIKISDGKVSEKFEVVEYNFTVASIKDEVGKSFIDYAKTYGSNYDTYTSYYNLYADEDCVEDCNYYEKKYIEDSDKVGFNLSNVFDLKNYSDSSVANEFLPSFQSSYDGKYLSISGDKAWVIMDSYDNLSDITINIETDYKVVSTNGKRDGNIYSWKINKDNYKSLADIYIVIDTSISSVVKESNSFIYILILLVILLICLLVYFICKKKQNNIYN